MTLQGYLQIIKEVLCPLLSVMLNETFLTLISQEHLSVWYDLLDNIDVWILIKIAS